MSTCVNYNNPQFQNLAAKMDNPLLAEVRYDEIYNDNTLPENPSLSEGLSWLESVLPGSNLELTSGLIDGVARGSYDTVDDVMKASREFASKGTIKHEAVHKVMNLIDPKKRDAILDAAASKFGIDRLNVVEVEERIAHFAELSPDYARPAGLLQQFVQWLKDLFHVFQSDKVDHLIRELNKGGYAELIRSRRSKLDENSDNVNRVRYQMAENAPKLSFKDKKIQRVDDQIAVLKESASKLNDKQLDTLNVILNNLEDYKQSIVNDQKTVSVSNLIGGGKLDTEVTYEDYSNFGTFMHFVVEEIQKESDQKGAMITSLLTRERFDKILEDYVAINPKKNMFNIAQLIEHNAITGVDEKGEAITEKKIHDDAYQMAASLLGPLQTMVSEGSTLLPEVSIMGKDDKGNPVVGRLDLLVLDKNGNIRVIDFKTKRVKLKSYTNKDSYLKEKNKITPSNSTLSDLMRHKTNTYDKWDLQLNIYENMIKQLGLKVRTKSIFAIVYYGNTDEQIENSFFYKNFDFRTYHSDPENNQDRLKDYNTFRKIIDKRIPTGETLEEIKEEEKAKQEHSMFLNMSDQEKADLIDRIIKTAQEQLSSARERMLQAEKEDPSGSEYLYWKNRIESLRSTIERSKRDDWELGTRLSTTIKSLEANMEELRQETMKAKDIEDNNLRNTKVRQLSYAAEGFWQFTRELKKLLINSGFEQNNQSILTLNKIENSMTAVQEVKNEIDLFEMIALIENSLSDRQKVEKSKARSDAYDIKIQAARKEIERIKKRGTPGMDYGSIFRKVQHAVGIRPEKPSDITIEKQIQDMELAIQNMEFQKRLGVSMTTAEIKKYIQDILNKDSGNYIGSQTSGLTRYMASASSSDVVTAAFANEMKLAGAGAAQEFINQMEREKVQEAFDAYKRSAGSLENMNSLISEVRSVQKYNDKGEPEGDPESFRSFINPVVQEYYDRYDAYERKLRALNRQIFDAPTPELKKERAELKTAHQQWRLENSHMEYVAEYYEMDKYLPEEYKQQRDELYAELRLLQDPHGALSNPDLAEDTQQRIHEIGLELKQLKLDTIRDGNGRYDEYLALQERFFAYEKNQALFDRIRNSKEVEFADSEGVIDQERMDEWLAENANYVATQEWHDEVSKHYDAIASVMNDNATVQRLNERRKEILARYRERGVLDPNYMTQQELDELRNIEDLKAEIKKESDKITKGQYAKIEKSFAALAELQREELNPYYVKELDKRTEVLDKKWDAYQEALGELGDSPSEAEQAEVDRLLEQVTLEEADYSVWYNNHHNDLYVPLIIREKPLAMDARSFNKTKVPSEDKYYTWEPNEKYSVRKVKESALNPHFQKDHNGYPMPKGTVKNGAIVAGDSSWINPAYTKLQQNPAAFTFYAKFIGRYLEVQNETTGKKLGYFYPGFEAKSADTYKQKGLIGGVAARAKLQIEKTFVQGGLYDHINEYASDGDRVQFRHNTTLPLDQQSSDGIASVILWREQAEINKAAAIIKPRAESILSYLNHLNEELQASRVSENDDRSKALIRVIEQVKFEYNKFVKGETKKEEGALSRYGDAILSGIGFTRLAYDIPNHIGNMLSGNVQAFLGSSNSGAYGAKNLAYAKKKIYGKDGLIAGLLRDQTKISGKSFMTKMFLYHNPKQEGLAHNYDRTRSQSDRIVQGVLDGNAAFWLQDKGETEIAGSVWLAILDNTRVKLVDERDAQGNIVSYQLDGNGQPKTINALEAYLEDPQTGEIKIRDDVEFSKADEFAVQKTVWSEIRRTQGNYADADKTVSEAGIIGRLLLYYRKYLGPAVRNRFARLDDSWESAEMTMGTYTGLLKALQYYGPKKLLMSLLKKDPDVGEIYQRKSIMALREMATTAALFVIGGMLASMIEGMDDEDDDTSKIIALNLMAVYLKVETEAKSMVPVPGIGGVQDYLTNFGSFTNATRDFEKANSLITQGFSLIAYHLTGMDYFQEKAYYQQDSGIFDEGEARIKKSLMELSGYMNVYEIFDPETRVDNTLKRR